MFSMEGPNDHKKCPMGAVNPLERPEGLLSMGCVTLSSTLVNVGTVLHRILSATGCRCILRGVGYANDTPRFVSLTNR